MEMKPPTTSTIYHSLHIANIKKKKNKFENIADNSWREFVNVYDCLKMDQVGLKLEIENEKKKRKRIKYLLIGFQ